jgi:polar amino acid transport system ATP-binding protein
VLRGVSVSLSAHEVVALIGASGSGKSTLLRCLGLLEPIDDGRIWLGELDISDPRVDGNRVRARLGAVFQSYNLFPTCRCSTTSRSPRASCTGCRGHGPRRAHDLLARVGLAEFATAHPDRLSGGQQQRARSCGHRDRSRSAADEITSALDPELVGEVLELVRALAADGTTILMATHEMAFARDVADRVVFLDDGVIVEEGAAASVFAAPQHPRTQAFLSRFSG